MGSFTTSGLLRHGVNLSRTVEMLFQQGENVVTTTSLEEKSNILLDFVVLPACCQDGIT